MHDTLKFPVEFQFQLYLLFLLHGFVVIGAWYFTFAFTHRVFMLLVVVVLFIFFFIWSYKNGLLRKDCWVSTSYILIGLQNKDSVKKN